MSNQLHLYVTNISNAQEAFDDECGGGDLQEALLEVPGDMIALLWVPIFKGATWQEILDKEQWEEADDDESKDDYLLIMPFIEVNTAISNLKSSEQNISEYFRENGGVKNLVEELVAVLDSAEYKYVYFNPTCGDFHYSRSEDKAAVESILAISGGDYSVKKENIASVFQLHLNKKKLFISKPIKFLSSKEVFSEGKEYNPIDGDNIYSLVGMLDEVLI